MPFILDASVTAAWLLPDEEHPLATHLEDHLLHDHFLVPPIWWFEVRNLLVVAERRMRLTLEQTAAIIANLAIYPIVEDNDVDEQVLLQLARAHALSIYDASYLELAGRLRLPLATLDNKLLRAAEAASIRLVVP
ncbi:type II toxin-antitoxin system VapC family toxin [Nitratireductor thuwali]|uniref:Ribonuclease VapC n=1 Tax=Nitratireductor thuwali TaxID=2267699 RepID=A0ABY5MKN6_9HYPH|nr:tRNA(fMet)-specific endonuclease VapC [Nitratireductor thuwali]